MSSILSAVSVLDLQSKFANPGDIVLVAGFSRPGDGGHGTFVAEDNQSYPLPIDGCINVLGRGNVRWRRLVDDHINVRWFGCVGDGVTDDTAAFQRAIDYRHPSSVGYFSGHDIVFAGTFKLTSPVGGFCLSLGVSHRLRGVGGPPYGASVLLLNGPGSGIEVRTTARGARIEGGSIRSGSVKPVDMLVVHANSVTVADNYIAGASRHGVVFESSNPDGSDMHGYSTEKVLYKNANTWRLLNNLFEGNGDWTRGDGDESKGASIFIHGSDSQGGISIANFDQGSNVSLFEASLGGNTHIAHYGEDCRVGTITRSAYPATFVGCYGEDYIPMRAETPALILGGTLRPAEQSTIVQYGYARTVCNNQVGPFYFYAQLAADKGPGFTHDADGDGNQTYHVSANPAALEFNMTHGGQYPRDAYGLTMSNHPKGSGVLILKAHYQGETLFGVCEADKRSIHYRNGRREVGDSFPADPSTGYTREVCTVAGYHGQLWEASLDGWSAGATFAGIPAHQVEVDGHVYRVTKPGSSGPTPPAFTPGAGPRAEVLSTTQAGKTAAVWEWIGPVPVYRFAVKLET